MIINTGLSSNMFKEMSFYNTLAMHISELVADNVRKNQVATMTVVNRWFNNMNLNEKNAFRKKVSRFRADLNLIKILVSEAELKKKKRRVLGTGARPGGLAERHDYSMTDAMNRLQQGDNAAFKYTLQEALYHLEPINTGDDRAGWPQTWFANFVHEHSHAFLGTHDVKKRADLSKLYGARKHLDWIAHPFVAVDKLDNTTIVTPVDCASCWGFFFEDMIPSGTRVAIDNYVKACRKSWNWAVNPSDKVRELL